MTTALFHMPMPHWKVGCRAWFVGTLMSTAWLRGRSFSIFRSGKATFFAQVWSVVLVYRSVTSWPVRTSIRLGWNP